MTISAIAKAYARQVISGAMTLEDVKERAPKKYDEVVAYLTEQGYAIEL